MGDRRTSTPGARRVLRNVWTASFGVVATLALLGFTVWLMLDEGVNDAVSERWFGATVMLIFVSFGWHVTVRPRVVVEPWGLTVVNPLFVHTAPWADVRECQVTDDGHMRITARSGAIEPFTFSGSLLALLGGARAARAAQRVIEDARPADAPSGVEVQASTRLSVEWRGVLVVWLAAGVLAYAP